MIKSKKRQLFKIFVVLVCLVEAPFQLLLFWESEPRSLEIMALMLNFLLLLSLIGLAWEAPLFSELFWKITLVVMILWQVSFMDLCWEKNVLNIGVLSLGASYYLLISLIFILVLGTVFKFLALYFYAFRSGNIWNQDVIG